MRGAASTAAIAAVVAKAPAARARVVRDPPTGRRRETPCALMARRRLQSAGEARSGLPPPAPGVSGTDEAEHLVAPGLHVLARCERLEVQAQKRLGVRRAHV